MAIRFFLFSIFVIFSLIFGIESAEIPRDICRGIKFGYLAHPDPTRCTEYLICFYEDFYVFNCTQPGHIFYLPYTYCVRGDPITCEVYGSVTTLRPTTTRPPLTIPTAPIESSTTTHASSTTISTTTTTENSVPDNFCSGITLGVFPHPDQCTQFVVCAYEISSIYTCPSYAPIFSYNACVSGDPATCEIFTSSTTTTSSSTTTSSTTTTTTAQAIETESTTTTIPSDTSTKTPEVTMISTTTIRPFPDDFCQNKTFGLYPHPFECTKFVICLGELPFINTCQYPTEIFFDGLCIEGDPETCKPYPPTTTTTERATGPPELCTGNDFNLVANPDYCYRFFYCILGVAFPGECPEDKIFSELHRGCIDGDRDECKLIA